MFKYHRSSGAGSRKNHSSFSHFKRHKLERLERRALFAAYVAGDPSVYATIQAAVDAALAGSTVTVDPGSYAEIVSINKPLTLRGSKAGIDGRSSQRGTNETIITGATDAVSGKNISTIYVNANGVTVDGFTVTGNTSNGMLGAGIVIAPNKAGSTIVNNILRENVAGLFLSNNSDVLPCTIKNNLFYNNNLDGDHSGRGIYTNGGFTGGLLTNVIIDSNAFIDNYGSKLTTTTLEAAIALQTLAPNSQRNIKITNNMFDGNGKVLLFFNVDNATIEGNFVTWTTDLWSAALRFEGGNTNIAIKGNTIWQNPGNIIRIDNKGVPGDNYGFVVTDNNIYSNGLNTTTKAFIVVDPGQYEGPFIATNNWWGSTAGPTGNMIMANGNNVISSPWAMTKFDHPANPAYMMLPFATDGKIEVEYFDHGGQGISFSDIDSANLGQGKVRRPFGVDLQATTDAAGGWNLGYTKPGEWLQYTMDIATAGTYHLDVRVAGTSTAGKFHFELDGVNITGSMSMLNTGGSQTWKTLTKSGIQLPAGRHVLRLVMEGTGTNSIGNFNWFQFRNATPVPAPLAPSGLATSVASVSQVNLTWTDNSSNESGFIIERKTGDGAWEVISTTAANVTGYIDNTVVASTTYTYRVRATNATGASSYTDESIATTPAVLLVTYLSDVPWLTASNGYGPVEKDMGNGGDGAGDGAPITLNGVVYPKGLGVHSPSEIVYNLAGKYNKFLSDIGVDDRQSVNGSVVFQVYLDGILAYDSGVMRALSATKSVNLNVAGVQQLKLVVTNGGDNSQYDHADWANARLLSDVPQTPATPGGLAAAPVSPTQIDLSWTDVAGEDDYRIERSLDGVTFVEIGTTGAGVTTFSDTTVTAGQTYHYRVIATNAVEGDSAPSASVSAQSLTPPAMPSGLVATPFSHVRIDLSWTDVANETGYRIERSLNGVHFVEIGTTTAGVTTYNDTTANPSTSYSYRVVAINAAGESPASSVANATTPSQPTAPLAPSNLVATLINHNKIDLTWTDNAVNETSFIIERSTDGVNFSPLATISSSNVTSYSDTTVTGLNVTYHYRVRAANAVGDSTNSNTSSATTPALPPPPVAANQLVAAAISSSRVDLVWQDNPTNESGSKIERSTDGVNFTQVGTTGANATNYSDTTGLSPATKYWYRVIAWNAGGDSAASNVSTATTVPLSGLPAGWTQADIGPVGLAGSTSFSGGTWTLKGAGVDLWSGADSFHFAYQQMTGDGTIIARVASLTNTDVNAKAGIMIRDTLAANSRHASAVVTPGGGIKFLRRLGTGGSTTATTVSGLKAPYWLKIVRVGQTFSTYSSANGTSWTLIGTQAVTMGSTVYVGLAVTSKKTSALATATFDNVSVTQP